VNGPSADYYITPEEAGRRIGRKAKTILNWIHIGKLGGAQGLCYVAGRPVIDWQMFEAAFIKRAA